MSAVRDRTKHFLETGVGPGLGRRAEMIEAFQVAS